ncbi:MAG: hypothetical protein NTY41_02035 [Proteobacteria bacterium]|nr:hypothetical protein [Pseudomonadota bacterium]
MLALFRGNGTGGYAIQIEARFGTRERFQVTLGLSMADTLDAWNNQVESCDSIVAFDQIS